MFSIFSKTDDTQDVNVIIDGLQKRIQNLVRTITELRIELSNSRKIIKLKDTELAELQSSLDGSEVLCEKVRLEFEEMKHDYKILTTSYKLMKLRSE